MKKIIAVAAGTLLVGSFTMARADVTFTGDARERLTWDQNIDFNNKKVDYDYGRIRLNAQMENKGGAYARVRMIFSNNGVWNGTESDHVAGQSGNYLTDWAYVGIPVGSVTVEAGLMPDYTSIWFLYDKRFDRLKATFISPDKNTTVAAFFDKAQEYIETPAYLVDPTQDKDINHWGGLVIQKFAGWEATAFGYYQEDQLPSSVSDVSGFTGTLRARGPAGPVNLLAEFSYRDKKLETAAKDDGYGGIVHANMNFGPADATAILGFTKNGFKADSNYGFLMMGNAMACDPSYFAYEGTLGSPIGSGSPLNSSTVSVIGDEGDNTFAGLVADYKINSLVTLYAAAAYNDINDYGKFTEFDGVVQFNVVQDAYISLGAACLIPKLDASGAPDKTNYGLFTELYLKF